MTYESAPYLALSCALMFWAGFFFAKAFKK
jgi:hypothetical protein